MLDKIIRNKKIIVGYLLIVSLFFFLSFIQINKSLRHEQDFFAYGAKKILENNKPEFNYGGYDRGKISIISNHPPLYIYSIALFTKIFGYNLLGLKFSGIFFTVLTSFLLFLMSMYLFPKHKGLSLVSVFIYLINPIVIQNALLLDIDGGILTFVTIATIFCFMKYKLNKPFLLGFFLFVGLWTKLTSYVILSAAFFIYVLFFEAKDKNIKDKKLKTRFYFRINAQKYIKLIAIFGISLIIFLLTYYIYIKIISFSDLFEQTILHNTIIKLGGKFTNKIIFLRWLGGLKSFVIWINPTIVLFFVAIFLRDIKKIINKNIRTEYILIYLIILIASSFFILTGAAVGWSGKYFVFIVPLLSLVISNEIEKILHIFNFKKFVWVILLLSIIVLEYYILFVGDPIFTQDIWMVFSQFGPDLIYSIMLKILLILAPLFIFLFAFRNKFLLSLIILILVFTTYSAFYTSFAKYSTNSNYGDYGLEETVEYIKNLADNKTSTIIAERGITFAFNEGDYLESASKNAYLYVAGEYYIFVEEFYDNALIVKNNTYLIIYEHNIHRTPGFEKHLDDNFDYVNKIGYYLIYKIK
ncbi:glycosyltransferase family 39 protein [Candidatus Pacearchaeota archaeon]|nr:glycosyltransferase family 39 protein [Candidatus Pacearchaeota archaeon]